jgi:hypothetical protein
MVSFQEGGKAVKNRIHAMLAGMMAAAVVLAASASMAQEAKIAVLNPRGSPPPIRLVPMAPRLDTLDGKTVYLIAASFAVPLMPELQKVLAERYPKTTWVLKNKPGSYFDDDPKLWAEAKEKSSAVIMGVGH